MTTLEEQCKENLDKHNIYTYEDMIVFLTKNAEETDTVDDFILDVYRLFIPEFDKTESISMWPKISLQLWGYISSLCNQIHRKETQTPNNAITFRWLNYGFSCGEHLKGIEVDFSNVTLKYNKLILEETSCQQKQ